MRSLISAIALSLALSPIAATAYGQEAQPVETVPTPQSFGKLTGRFAVIPYKGRKSAEDLKRGAAAVATIPFWSRSIVTSGQTYPYMMVGKAPMVKQANPVSSIKTIIVPVKFVFKNAAGTKILLTRDPTAADPTCSPHGTALDQVKNSPVLMNISDFTTGGVNLGTGQYVSLFQRGNFYKYTKSDGVNPGYQVQLAPVVTFATQTVIVQGGPAAISAPCGKIGLYDFYDFDNLVQNTFLPKLAARGYGPKSLPIFLFYNVTLDDPYNQPSCCIQGYHSAFDNPNFGGAFQTYAVANYDSSQYFTNTSDISALTHEIAEWMDDPKGDNPTPPWGPFGQVSGCQDNLEVGDPLSHHNKPITLNGFTYQVQDLAFFSWFYRQNPSIGVNGWYSLYGAFQTVPSRGVCGIAAGNEHTCALTSAGGVKCWGLNSAGQLGDGTTTERHTPVNVSGLTSGVSAIAAGVAHTCVLTGTAGVKCWGRNGEGQLGDGTTTLRTTPVDVSGLTSGVSAIVAGNYHTCALTSVGGAKCWGWNLNGQLGDGTTTDRDTPVDVSGLTSGVGAVAAGYDFTCALTSAGGIKCWGWNGNGQLGDGTTTQHTNPVDVSGLTSGVSAIAAGSFHNCALTGTGGLKCWGWNGFGSLGDGTTTDRHTAVDVSGLSSGVSAITLGGDSTCALTGNRGLKCWGANWNGQLGDGTTTQRNAPVDVSGLTSGVGAVAAGGGHTCATSAGGAKCWGWNFNGELGDGTTIERHTPIDVSGL